MNLKVNVPGQSAILIAMTTEDREALKSLLKLKGRPFMITCCSEEAVDGEGKVPVSVTLADNFFHNTYEREDITTKDDI